MTTYPISERQETLTKKEINQTPLSRDKWSNILANPLLSNQWLHIAVLIALVVVCFARTLTSYFLADDIGEIAYVARIFHGHPELFWLNFTGNYMQIGSMSVYRPFLLISLVADYLVWGANASGYYLTNLLYYAGDVVLFYILVRQLTNAWPKANHSACAFFAAALFAVSPLHLESISWVVGRVDIISCFYYLLSMSVALLAKQKQNKVLTIAAVSMFFLALFTKEMAIGLPVMLTAIAFFLPQTITATGNADKQYGFKQRLHAALNLSWPFWLATGFYFILRFVALGTIGGGYVGSIGAAQFANIYTRWFDADTLTRLVLPFNYFIFHGANVYSNILLACYGLMAIILCHRLFKGELKYQWPALIILWLATCAAPIYQLWGLGYNLEGSRFYFFLTLPLALLCPVIIFQPKPANHQASSNFWPTVVGVATLLTMVAVCERTAYINNTVWLKAGKCVKALRLQSQILADKTPANDRLLVLGLPKELGGAHMIENGDTYLLLLKPPFSKTDVSDRFLTFDPIVFGPSQFFNSSRFKNSINEKNVLGPFLFEDNHFQAVNIERLVPDNSAATYDLLSANCQPYVLGHEDMSMTNPAALIEPSSESVRQDSNAGVTMRGGRHKMSPLQNPGPTTRVGQAIDLYGLQANDGIKFSGLNINPCDFDYLQGDIAASNSNEGKVINVLWNADNGEASSNNQVSCIIGKADKQGLTHFAVNLSHNWHWFTNGKIKSIHLQFFASRKLRLSNLQLVKANKVVPEFTIAGGTLVNTGVYVVGNAPLVLTIKPLPTSTSLEVQISKPNCFFENLQADKQAALIGRVLSPKVSPAGNSATISIAPGSFAQPGFYQIRIACKNQNGQQLGELSPSETIEISR